MSKLAAGLTKTVVETALLNVKDLDAANDVNASVAKVSGLPTGTDLSASLSALSNAASAAQIAADNAQDDATNAKTLTDRLKITKPSTEGGAVAYIVGLALDGSIKVSEKANTVEYEAGLGLGANRYVLKDAVTSGARPAEDGGSIIHVGTEGLYFEGLFLNGVWLEQFGVKKTGDNAAKIKAALDYAESKNRGEVKAQGNVYPTSSLILTKNVAIVGPEYNALNVHDMSVTPADETGTLVLQAVSGSTGILILANGDSKVSGLKNCIVDATTHTGDVVVFTGSGSEVRHNNFLKNVLIYKGTGKQLWMTADNNGSLIENVFCRGGVDRITAVSDYGIYDESQDSKIFNCFAAFCKLRSIFDAAGSGRRKDVDAWGSQQQSMELTGSSRYNSLQIDGSGLGGLKISSAKNAAIFLLKLVNNNQNNATVDGDIEVTGDCRGTTLSKVQLLGTDAGVMNNAMHQISTAKTGIAVSDVTIATSYTNQLNETAEAYWELSNIRTTNFVHRLMRANQINPNLSFAPHAASAPSGWVTRNNGASVVELVDLPTSYHSAAKITSSVTGTSGIQYTGKTVDEVRNTRVRIKALVKGSGATSLGNQFLQIFDGVTSPKVDIPNNATWTEVAIIHNIPDAATNFQVRLVASNATTAGLILYVTAVTIEVY